MNAGLTVQVDAGRFAKLEEMERKSKLSARRASVKNLIFVEKAKAAKIVVTKAEVDARIAADDAKKVVVAAQVADCDPGTDEKADEIAKLVAKIVSAN